MNPTEESNNNKLKACCGKELLLLDSSAFQICEEWGGTLGFNLLEKIQRSESHSFFVTNEVWVELVQRRRPEYMATFYKSILNVEASMSHQVKINVFPIEVDGKLVALDTNAISAADFNQVWLCVNHPELTLVSNDRKLLKTAGRVLKGRVLGPVTFMRKFISHYPDDSDLQKFDPFLQSVREKKVL